LEGNLAEGERESMRNKKPQSVKPAVKACQGQPALSSINQQVEVAETAKVGAQIKQTPEVQH
jgi:hypothetical protein